MRNYLKMTLYLFDLDLRFDVLQFFALLLFPSNNFFGDFFGDGESNKFLEVSEIRDGDGERDDNRICFFLVCFCSL